MAFGRILEEYCAAFGQKMNLLKSVIYFNLKTKTQQRQVIKKILGIVEHTGVLYYLRVLITWRWLRRFDYTELAASTHGHLEG